jgi:predicted transcriptional regulator
MENPNLSQLATAPPSLTSILKKISENKAYVLFNNLATSNNNGRFIPPLKEMNLSTKQYYSRLTVLSEAGLIKRHKSTYSLTLLGKVVYDSQMIIGEALSHYWKLKAIETIEVSSSSNLPVEEITQLINALIDNPRIKDILMKPADIPCDETKPKIEISTPIATQTQTQSIQNQKDTDTVT